MIIFEMLLTEKNHAQPKDDKKHFMPQKIAQLLLSATPEEYYGPSLLHAVRSHSSH